MPANVGNVYATVVPTMKGFEKAVNDQLSGVDTTKAGKKIGSSLGSSIVDGMSSAASKLSAVGDKLTSSITVPLVTGAAAVGAFALKTASAAETTEISFTTMLGSAEAATQMMEKLADFAAKTPFELSGLQDATRQLLAYGFTAEDVLPMLTAVGDATAALGTGQQGIEAVTRALGQMKTRGKVSAEEMLQLTEQGIPAWEYLARAIGTDTAGAMDAVKDGAVSATEGIEALTSGMEEDFGGMMESQSKTLEGLASNFADAIEQPFMELRNSDAYSALADQFSELIDAAGPFVEELLPHLETGLEAATSLLGAATGAMETFSNMSDEAQSGVMELAVGAAAAGPALKVAGTGLDLLSGAGKGVSKVLETVGGKALPKVVTSLGELGGPLASVVSTVSGAAGPVGILATLVGGSLVAALAAFAVESAEAAEHQALLDGATMSAADIMSEASTAANGLGDAIADIEPDVEVTLDSLRDLNEETKDLFSDTKVDSAKLDQYLSTINELANQSGLTATQQYRLQEAVEGYNEVVGTQYSVVDAANGKIADQNGVIQENTDQLNENASAWKNRAQSEALSNVATKYMEAEAEASYQLQIAQDNLASSTQEYNSALDEYNSLTNNGQNPLAEGAYDAAQRMNEARDSMNEAQTQVDELSIAYDTASQNAENFSNSAALQNAVFGTLGENAADFVTQLMASGADMSTFTSMTDEQLTALAGSWDGTIASVIDSMNGMGVQVPAQMYQSMLGMNEALTVGGGQAITTAMQVSGLTAQQFADKVDEYGLTGNAAITNFARGIANGDSYEVAAQKAQEAANGLGTASGSAATEGAEVGSSYASGIGSASGDVSASAEGLASTATDAASGASDALAQEGTEGGEGFASGIGSAQGATSSAAQGLADAASSMNSGDSYSWGADLGSQFAAGISSMWSSVTSAASSLASAAADFLHFSTPEKGPFSGSEHGGVTSGKHLGENFAEGLTEAIPDISDAASGAASAAKEALSVQSRNVDGIEDSAKAMRELADSMSKAEGESDDSTKSLSSLVSHVADVAEEAVSGSQTLDGLAAALDRAGVSYSDEFIQEILDGSDEYGSAMVAMSDMTDQQVQEIVDTFDKAQLQGYINEVRKALVERDGLRQAFQQSGVSVNDFAAELRSLGVTMDDVTSLMDDLAEATLDWENPLDMFDTPTLHDMIYGLKRGAGQAEFFAQNVEKVFDKIVDYEGADAFKAEVLSGGFDKYAQVMYDLSRKSRDEIISVIELWNDAAEAGKGAGESIVESIVPKTLDSTQYETLGQSVTDGMAQGIADGTSTVTGAVATMCSAIESEVKSYFGIASPSKLMRSLFVYVGEGAAMGLLDSVTNVSRAARSVDDAAMLSSGSKYYMATVGTGGYGGAVIDQTINFNQPVQTPAQTAAMMRRYANYGLAAARR